MEPSKTTIGTVARPAMKPQQSLTPNRPEQHPANYFSFHLGVHQSQHNNRQQSSVGLMKRGAEYKGEQSIYIIIPALFKIEKNIFNAAVTHLICLQSKLSSWDPLLSCHLAKLARCQQIPKWHHSHLRLRTENRQKKKSHCWDVQDKHSEHNLLSYRFSYGLFSQPQNISIKSLYFLFCPK